MDSRQPIRIVLLGALIWFSFAANALADCDAEFAALGNESKYPDIGARIDRWKSLDSECGSTGEYELRLGALLSTAGRTADARTALLRGLEVKSDYLREIRLSLFDLDLQQSRVAEAEQRALSLLTDFPKWRGGHRALGQIRLVQGRFAESVAELEEANAIEPASGTYVLLTMAYYKQNLYRECAQSMQRALRLDRSALAHTQAVVAATYSLLALDHLPEADDLLKKHLIVQPDALQDPYYAAAVKRIGAERDKAR